MHKKKQLNSQANELADKIINNEFYPNALALLKVDASKKSVQLIGVAPERCDMRKKTNNKPESAPDNAHKDIKVSKKRLDAINKIWKNIGLGKIDISYACVGYTLNGRPVLEYGLFIDMLVNYGFNVDDAICFIDEFSDIASKDNASPVVMTDGRRAKIMTEVKPLE